MTAIEREDDDPAPAGVFADDATEPGVEERSSEHRYSARVDEIFLRQCVERVVDRDEHALSKLYEAMVGRVFGLALRITRNVQTAEEVAEDTFWQIWREAPRAARRWPGS